MLAVSDGAINLAAVPCVTVGVQNERERGGECLYQRREHSDDTQHRERHYLRTIRQSHRLNDDSIADQLKMMAVADH